MDDGEDGETTTTTGESFLSEEIQNYSSRFISDESLHGLVNGITCSWKTAVAAHLATTDQGYEEWEEEEVEEEEGQELREEDPLLLQMGWEFVTHDDCAEEDSDEHNGDLSDVDRDWEIITKEDGENDDE